MNSMPNNSHYGSPFSDQERQISRTPSPTPSEQAALQDDGKMHLSTMPLKTLIIYVVITALVVLTYVFHEQLVNDLKPAGQWMHDRPGGFLMPIAIMTVLSFPPLFGQEFIIILAGFTWGLWEGFAIAVAGTLVGELINFAVFKLFCTARGQKMERTNIQYACLARVFREGGVIIAVIARYSTIPGHVTTMIFSVCGVSVWTYLIAAVLSLPKQFATVYVGYVLTLSTTEKKSEHAGYVQWIIIGVTTAVTIFATRYTRTHRLAAVPDVVYERRKRRQADQGLFSRKSEGGVGTSYPPASGIYAPQPRSSF